MLQLKLNTLEKLVKKRKRVGRGGSRGGTSGKGGKGQKARSGDHGVGFGFEGGQMPLVRRLPKRGFNNKDFSKKYYLIHLSDLEKHFKNNEEVSKDALVKCGVLKYKTSKKGVSAFLVKLLDDGKFNLTKKLIIRIDAASKSAAQAVEKAGGSVQLIKEN